MRRLETRGVVTVEAFARAPDEARPAAMAPRTYETPRDQAAMQVAARTNGHAWKVLPAEPARGFELLPEPSFGDLFFDIEGDPFWEPGRGLEYSCRFSSVVVPPKRDRQDVVVDLFPLAFAFAFGLTLPVAVAAL